ncbi:hypothetical protein [Pedobacter psychrodurus]|uniref:hypothetical protein n=1 Tax=Pedobacter psychrodurus TaxID=2530456 RepID=UPI0013F15533|nr:hypothetical protein [Pedobacter psychrodurus]
MKKYLSVFCFFVSQLLTSRRLAKGFDEEGLYGIIYDETTVQYVLNMMELVIR